MIGKKIDFKVKGIQRDLSNSSFNPEYAYDIKNMRIYPTDENTLLSLINEKGNKLGYDFGVGGHIVGNTVIGNTDVVFIKGTYNDLIFTIEFDSSDKIKVNTLFVGNLNFDTKHPIECIGYYENDDIQKIYFTDGVNQPRVINIAASSSVISTWTNDSFNFVRELKLQENVTISKNLNSSGIFSPGVVQYSIAYYNQYMQETNIFYTSSLLYATYLTRGGAPDEKVTNSFNITISNIDTSFDYIRVYCMERTTLDAEPTVRIVRDINIMNIDTTSVSIIDTGSGDTIAATDLYYIGGESITAGTFEQKDNTLFLGDIKVSQHNIPTTVKNNFRSLTITYKADKQYQTDDSFSYPEPSTSTSDTQNIVTTSSLVSSDGIIKDGIPSWMLPTSSGGSTSLVWGSPKGYYPYYYRLNKQNKDITTFKSREYYRFGVQFQYKTGKWSEPVFINDVQNNLTPTGPYNIRGYIDLVSAHCTLDDTTLKGNITALQAMGFIKVRPVIVYPTLSDRSVLCQGVVNPTVYNTQDRIGNSPFSQASWFFRPNIPYDITKSANDTSDREGKNVLNSDTNLNTRSKIILNDYKDSINMGSWLEFRDEYCINNFDIGKRSMEIQMDEFSVTNNLISNTSDINSFASARKNVFAIDKSIVTFNSPEIELDDTINSIDLSNTKFRIIGCIPITSFIGDVSINTSTAPKQFSGFYKENTGAENISKYGFRYQCANFNWFDSTINTGDTYKDKSFGFMVYPWNRSGSLSDISKNDDNGVRAGQLKYKKMSNLHYSYNTVYFNDSSIWNPTNGISDAKLFSSDEVSLVKLTYGEKSVSYYGNVDKVLTVTSSNGLLGYSTFMSALSPTDISVSIHDAYLGATQSTGSVAMNNILTDPVNIKYKETPHIVISFNPYINEDNNYLKEVLPTLYDDDKSDTTWANKWIINDENATWSTLTTVWDSSYIGIHQSVIDYNFSQLNGTGAYGPEFGWLWLGELYRDVDNRFGGTSEEALTANTWVVGGEAKDLTDGVELQWNRGDTYYMRYDCLKTYPYTLEDENSITDILSFMVETRVNLDGRYDKNRGQTSYLVTTPDNFNLINKVYSQSDNFFTYNYINSSRLEVDNFKNSVTWTTSKTPGDIIDNWTNITLASTLDLDGDKGNINALRRFNNEIYAFQDYAISNIMFNTNAQINSTSGVPIQLANSGKVDGKRYITNTVGCINKWSITQTSNGLYFIDDNSKGIYLFNGGLNNLSEAKGMKTWVANVANNIIWNPEDFNAVISQYNNKFGDVMFITKSSSLIYSEPLGTFMSFIDYSNTPYIANVGNHIIDLYQGDSTLQVWQQNEGDYNMFYGEYKPYSITLKVVPDFNDKVFNNIEFRSDSWDNGTLLDRDTLDTLSTQTEYQSGVASLIDSNGNYTENLKKKFRVYRALIPRDSTNVLNRIRGTWATITLSKETINTYKTILHDIGVQYFY